MENEFDEVDPGGSLPSPPPAAPHQADLIGSRLDVRPQHGLALAVAQPREIAAYAAHGRLQDQHTLLIQANLVLRGRIQVVWEGMSAQISKWRESYFDEQPQLRPNRQSSPMRLSAPATYSSRRVSLAMTRRTPSPIVRPMASKNGSFR